MRMAGRHELSRILRNGWLRIEDRAEASILGETVRAGARADRFPISKEFPLGQRTKYRLLGRLVPVGTGAV